MGFKIDFSETDAGQIGQSAVFDALPAGDYPVVVSDIELAEVKSGNNEGKPMYRVTLTIEDKADDAKYNGRKLWCNVMLFTVYDSKTGNPNNFFLSQFINATGNSHLFETGEVPGADVFLGKNLIANVKRAKDTYNWSEGDPIKFKNEVKGFQPLTTETISKGKAKKTNSLLP